MMKKIFISQEEEIISIVDKILQSAEKDIVLFFPRGAQIFQSNINLKLLRREMDNAEKNVVIVTEDENGQKMAQKNDFVVFNSGQELEYFYPAQEEAPEKKQPAKKSAEKETVSIKPSEKPNQERARGGRVIDLRTVNGVKRTADILPTKKDDNYFQKLIEEKEKFKKEDFFAQEREPERATDNFLNIRVDEEPAAEPIGEGFAKPDKTTPLPLDYPEKISSAPREGPRAKARKTFSFFKPKFSETKTPAPTKEPGKERMPLVAGCFAVLGFLVLAGVIYFVLPKAEIFLTLKKEKASAAILATAEENQESVDLQKNKIPARVLEVEKRESQTFPSTGEKQVNEKARGTIVVYNQYSSEAQTLVETTRFLSSEGKLFRTTETITVPGAKIIDGKISPSSIEAEVVADEAGESFNIGPSDFTIPGFKGSPKYEGFYGKSTSTMSGGRTGLVKVVSEGDMQKAITEFSNQKAVNLVEEIKNQVPEGYVLLNECIGDQKSENKSEAEVGDAVDNFEIAFEFSIKAIVFSDMALRSLVIEKLKDQEADVSLQLEEESLLIEYKKAEPDFASGRLDLYLNATGDFVRPIQVDLVKEELRGKKTQEIKQYFSSLPGIEKGEVKFWPFFVRSIPQSTDRIEITVQ